MSPSKPLPTPAYPLGSIVYLRVNPERKGMVSGLLYRPGGVVVYLVTWDDPIDEREHWACEITDERQYREAGGLSGSEDGS